MKAIKQIFSRFYIYVLWALLSFLLWGWIFGIVTDTTTFHKVSIYVDCAEIQDLDLTLELEADLPEGIKMVKVHPMSYVVFDETTMLMGDILILRESSVEGYLEALCPMGDWGAEYETYAWDGQVYGIRVYDADAGQGILADYVTFLGAYEAQEDFYLVFLNDSHHLGSLNDSVDDAAIQIAERLLNLQ